MSHSNIGKATKFKLYLNKELYLSMEFYLKAWHTWALFKHWKCLCFHRQVQPMCIKKNLVYQHNPTLNPLVSIGLHCTSPHKNKLYVCAPLSVQLALSNLWKTYFSQVANKMSNYGESLLGEKKLFSPIKNSNPQCRTAKTQSTTKKLA